MAYREHWRNTHDIVVQKYWPSELVDLIKQSASGADQIEDVDVRSVGLVTTYAWKMSATEDRLELHLKQFNLAAVSPNGIEHKRIISRWPHAWSLPTSNFDMYANPVGLPGADEGEFEFVLLHDKGAALIYFYYYFNF